MANKGILYLIPTHLDNSNNADFYSFRMLEEIKEIDHFIVENLRNARRFLSSLKLGLLIEKLKITELPKGGDVTKIMNLAKTLTNGQNMGLLSDAGFPCIADPGASFVCYCHQVDIPVKPITGHSSIIMALISSGFNGQQFVFHGYLPIDQKQKLNKIREMEKNTNNTGTTQLFMETPYRNDQLLESLFKVLHPDTYLSIALDISSKEERILTKSIEKWKMINLSFRKRPAIFSIGLPQL